MIRCSGNSKPELDQRGSNALARLAHRGVRQPDERERGQPAVHVDLDVDLARGDADHGEGASDGEHAARLGAAASGWRANVAASTRE